MNKKRLFSSILSWLLVITLIAGCAATVHVQVAPTTQPGATTVGTIATSIPGTQPSSSVIISSTGSSVPSTQPGTTAPSTTAPSSPATQPAATAPATLPTQPSTTPATTPPTTPPATQPDTTPASKLEVHFIDVGQADSILVLCDGEAMLIDGGNRDDSNLVYTYLKDRNIIHLKYVVGTHAHEDHIGGIAGALQYATVDTVYCASTSYTTQAFKNFANAVKNRGKSIVIPTIGTTFTVGSAVCTILAVNTDKEDLNNTSIVMRMVHGEKSFLFTGDAEDIVEKKLLNSGVTLKSDVLKVGHHGSNSSTTYPFLREVMPQYAVICVGADNDYGHPTSNVLSRLRDADVTTFRTDKHGDVICVSDGKTLTFTPSKNANINPYVKIGPNSTQQ